MTHRSNVSDRPVPNLTAFTASGGLLQASSGLTAGPVPTETAHRPLAQRPRAGILASLPQRLPTPAPRTMAMTSPPSPITVSPVESRRDLREFVDFPWQVYRDDPQWVPPLKHEVRRFLDRRRHPFYRHGEALPLLARLGNRVVGRVVVSDDPRYNEQHGTNLGAFGMFECLDDTGAAAALVDAASAWLRGRGRTHMWGPIDYSTNYPCGLLVDGFDAPPRVMMNHHPPYYESLLASCGFRRAKDLYAWWFTDPHGMLERWRRRADRLAQRSGVTVRPLRFDDFEAEVERCMHVYNESWEQSWGFVKMTRDEFYYLARSLRRLAVPELLLLAEYEGEPIGFSMTLPDFNEALRPLNGRLTTCGLPIGLARFLWRLRRVKTARMAVLGVREGFRRRGVTELLILSTLDHGKNVEGYTAAELSWTLEDNELINRAIETVGARRYKTYRLYEKAL